MEYDRIDTASRNAHGDDELGARYLLWLVAGLVSASIAGPVVLLYALAGG